MVELPAALFIHITTYRLNDRIIPSKEVFALLLSRRLRRLRLSEILKIVINWMLSGENWPIRVGRSAFPASKVFIGVIDLPAKRELIGLSVSRSAIRRGFIVRGSGQRDSSCIPSYRILILSLAEVN